MQEIYNSNKRQNVFDKMWGTESLTLCWYMSYKLNKKSYIKGKKGQEWLIAGHTGNRQTLNEKSKKKSSHYIHVRKMLSICSWAVQKHENEDGTAE